MPDVTLLIPSRCGLGENPLWDEKKHVFYWADIDAGEVHAWSEATGQATRIYSGPKVGGFTLEADGALALFRVNDIARRLDVSPSSASRRLGTLGLALGGGGALALFRFEEQQRNDGGENEGGEDGEKKLKARRPF